MKVSGKNVFNELDIKNIRKVYLSKNFKDKDIIEFIQKNKIKYVISDPKVMDGMIRNNQGIIVDINDFEYSDISVIDDDFIEPILIELQNLDTYWHTIQNKNNGLAYSGITLIPPSSIDVLINILYLGYVLTQC